MIDPRALRSELRARRERMSPAERIAAAMAVAARVLELPQLHEARTVAGYWAVRGEVPLLGVVNSLPSATRYCLPLLHDDHSLRFAPWRSGDAIAPNRYGIPEPADKQHALEPERVGIVLLPLLGFTRNGDRIGTGGGWYDRSFAFRKAAAAPPLLVGVGFACQQVDEPWTPQPWDVPLDAIVTERESLRF